MRRSQIDPKTFRKHSKIVEKHQDTVLIAGNREQTDYGYVIEGHKNKSFETKYVCIMPNSITPKWLHDKKTRVLRVIGGVGHLEIFSESGEVTVKPMTFGDELVVEAGTTYRIKSSPAKLEFFVTQEAKYESSLKELAPAELVANVPVEELQGISQEDKTHQTNAVLATDRSMRRNRAREQIAAQRGQQITKGRGPDGQRPGTSEEDFFRNGAAANSFNAMPVTHFDPESAG